MVKKGTLLTIGLLLAGCSETMTFKSYPPGARVKLDGSFIGTTPLEHSVPRGEVRDGHAYEIEYSNCDPASGTVATGIGGGRIVGYLFTVGLTAIFKGPRYFRPVDVQLVGGDCKERPGVAAGVIPPGLTINQIVGDRNVTGNSGEAVNAPVRLSERLSILRDLYTRKLITEEEYERERAKAVGEFEKSTEQPQAR